MARAAVRIREQKKRALYGDRLPPKRAPRLTRAQLEQRVEVMSAIYGKVCEMLDGVGLVRADVGREHAAKVMLGGARGGPDPATQGYSSNANQFPTSVISGNPVGGPNIWERAALRVRHDVDAPEGYWTRKYLLYLAASEETILDLTDPARRIIALTQLVRDYGRVFTMKTEQAHLIAAEKGVDYTEEVKGMTDEELAAVTAGVNLDAPAARPKQKWTRGGYREKLAKGKSDGRE